MNESASRVEIPRAPKAPWSSLESAFLEAAYVVRLSPDGERLRVAGNNNETARPVARTR